MGEVTERLTAAVGERYFRRAGVPYRWISWSSFLLLKLALENDWAAVDARLAEVRDVEREAHRRINFRGLTAITTEPYDVAMTVFGMTALMDGGKVDTPPGYLDGAANQDEITKRLEALPDDFMKQVFPSDYRATYWPTLFSLAEYLRVRGFRMEFVVFADAQIIMPDSHQQQYWLDIAFDVVRDMPNIAVREGNELDRNGANGVLALKVKPSNPGNVLWASGDYDIAERPEPLPFGRYVDYHGDRDEGRHVDESGKQGDHWYTGYNDPVLGNWGIGAKRPCINGEPQCAASVKFNRWGDLRETDPHQIGDAARGGALGSAGWCFHYENGCLSRPMDTVERECAIEFMVQMLTVPVEAIGAPYSHDTFDSHPLVNANGGCGESVSKTVGDQAWTMDSNPVDGFQPQPKPGWAVVKRSGPKGNHLELKRA